jgi:hypothetical protein
MRRKLTIEFVRSEFEKEGYKLVTKIYKNSKQKLELVCPRGHTWSVSWNHWGSLGSRCIYCYDEDTILTIEYIRSEFEREGYTLLTTVYENNRQKLDYICPNGYKHQITWGHWDTSKARCPCHDCNLIGNNIKYTLEQAGQEFKKVGYTLLVDEYINSKIKMKCKCNRGHIVYMSLYAIMHGHKCQICVKNKRLTIDFVKKEFAKKGYTLLSINYKNNKQKLKYRCRLGHVHYMRFDSWSNGRECPTCKKIKLSINRSGNKHWNWRGGISCEPYCQDWTKEYREYIKERDGHKCLNPYCTSKNPNELSVHHIDYNKKSCGPENLITVCRSCNTRANTDRVWHTNWYQAILNKKYGYIYE